MARLVQCNTTAANVSPTAPHLQLDTRRHESVLHHTDCKVLRAAANTSCAGRTPMVSAFSYRPLLHKVSH